MRLHLGFTSPVGVLPKVVGLMRVCLIKVGFIVLTIYVPCTCAETGLLQQLNKMRAGTVQGVHQSSQKSSLLHVVTLKCPVIVFPSEGRTHGTCGIRVFLKEVTAEYRFILLKIWEVKFETN